MKKLGAVLFSVAGDITCYPVPHGDRFDIGKLGHHLLVMLEVLGEFIIIYFDEVDGHALYVCGSDLSHAIITVSFS